jgi:hypothetical protein
MVFNSNKTEGGDDTVKISQCALVSGFSRESGWDLLQFQLLVVSYWSLVDSEDKRSA